MKEKKKIILDLALKYGTVAVEKQLVKSYLDSRKIAHWNSILISNYFEDFEENSMVSFIINKIVPPNVKELEDALALLLPENIKSLNGIFFTPDFIVKFIINELVPEPNAQILDPCCGYGAFLIGIVEYYKSKFGKSIKQTLQENIFAADILNENVNKSKLLLTIFALQNDELIEETDFRIRETDSLRADWGQKYDYVVGNPPYVKFQDLNDVDRGYLNKEWRTAQNGTFNLYFTFFELGYKLLKETGKLGYITPNNYFTSLSGESLRRFFQEKKCIYRIIDFNHKKVFDVQTYTAITFLSKVENPQIYYDRISTHQTPETFLQKANGSPNILANQNAKKWRLLKSDEQINIKTIETIGISLGSLFDICVGVATLKDEVYFIDGMTRENDFYIKVMEGKRFLIEAEVTKGVYKISDFKNQEELDNNKRRIICPYHIINNGNAFPIELEEMKRKFPACLEYLEFVKKVLILRDKGKITYSPFYVWGRTQGIAKRGVKLLTPTFSKNPRFLIAKNEDNYFTNGYGLFLKNTPNSNLDLFSTVNEGRLTLPLLTIQKILNSKIMDYYVDKTSVAIEGGYPCYQKNFIERFSIPNFTKEEIYLLNTMESKQEIDDFLIWKYKLSLAFKTLSVNV